jgi:hypothetical protein
MRQKPLAKRCKGIFAGCGFGIAFEEMPKPNLKDPHGYGISKTFLNGSQKK